MRTPKTADVRGEELFNLVHGKEADYRALSPALHLGWVRLGKAVLKTETKWAEAKNARKDLTVLA